MLISPRQVSAQPAHAMRYLNKSVLTQNTFHNLSAEILEIRKAFEAYDTEKDGVISLSEFKAVFSQFNYTDEEMNDMFDNVVRRPLFCMTYESYQWSYL